jgi:hypothetical protein
MVNIIKSMGVERHRARLSLAAYDYETGGREYGKGKLRSSWVLNGCVSIFGFSARAKLNRLLGMVQINCVGYSVQYRYKSRLAPPLCAALGRIEYSWSGVVHGQMRLELNGKAVHTCTGTPPR